MKKKKKKKNRTGRKKKGERPGEKKGGWNVPNKIRIRRRWRKSYGRTLHTGKGITLLTNSRWWRCARHKSHSHSILDWLSFFANALATLTISPSFGYYIFQLCFFLLFVTHSCSVSAGGFIQVVNKINFLASEYVILVLRDSRTQFKGEERGIEIWQRDS